MGFRVSPVMTTSIRLHICYLLFENNFIFNFFIQRGAPLCPFAVPEIFCLLFASQNFDRGTLFASLNLPLAALDSSSTSIRLRVLSFSFMQGNCKAEGENLFTQNSKNRSICDKSGENTGF